MRREIKDGFIHSYSGYPEKLIGIESLDKSIEGVVMNPELDSRNTYYKYHGSSEWTQVLPERKMQKKESLKVNDMVNLSCEIGCDSLGLINSINHKYSGGHVFSLYDVKCLTCKNHFWYDNTKIKETDSFHDKEIQSNVYPIGTAVEPAIQNEIIEITLDNAGGYKHCVAMRAKKEIKRGQLVTFSDVYVNEDEYKESQTAFNPKIDLNAVSVTPQSYIDSMEKVLDKIKSKKEFKFKKGDRVRILTKEKYSMGNDIHGESVVLFGLEGIVKHADNWFLVDINGREFGFNDYQLELIFDCIACNPDFLNRSDDWDLFPDQDKRVY